MPSTDMRRYYRGVHYPTNGSSPSPTSSSSTSPMASHLSKKKTKSPHHWFVDHHDQASDYYTKKKVETKTTKNTEKRIQRQLVLNDGRVIDRASPEVVVDRVEDSKTYEENYDRDDRDANGRQYRFEHIPRLEYAKHSKRRDVADDIVDDRFTRIINTHDVQENETTTKASQPLGRISRRALDKALRENRPIRDVIKKSSRSRSEVASRPKVVHTQKRHKKIIDTEDIHNISRRLDNGKVFTETYRTQEHEVINDREDPDTSSHTTRRSPSDYCIKDKQKYSHLKNEDFTEYYRVPTGSHNLKQSQFLGKGKHITAEEREFHKGRYDWDELSDRIKQNREMVHRRLHATQSAERKDALTKKPLNFFKEEKTRKKETDKWLEQHFGSDWSLTTSSSGSNRGRLWKYQFDQNGHYSSKANNHNNRTTQDQQANSNPVTHGNRGVRRSMSFTSIPIAYQNPPSNLGDYSRTLTKEKEKVVKTTTTTYHPTMETTTHTTITRDEYPAIHQKRLYNSTFNLASPQIDYPLLKNGSITSSRRSQKESSPLIDRFHSTQSLHRRSHHHNQPQHHQYQHQQEQSRRYEEERRQEETRQEKRRQEERRHEERRQEERRQEETRQHQEDRQQAYKHRQEHQTRGHWQDQQQTTRHYQPEERQQQQRQHHQHQEQHHHQHHQQQQQQNTQNHQQFQNKQSHHRQTEESHSSRRYHHTSRKQEQHNHNAFNREELESNHSRRSRPVTIERMPEPKERRVYPTFETQETSQETSQEAQQTGFASETRRGHVELRQPLYITEFRKEKLYPAYSENNLLTSTRLDDSRYSNKFQPHQQSQSTDRYQARDYLGFRSLERSDARNSVSRENTPSPSDSSKHSKNSSGLKGRSRSHSFLVKPSTFRFEDAFYHHRHDIDNDFIYDRNERKFVKNTSLKHGHSDLRLDRNVGGGSQDHLRLTAGPYHKELVHHQHQIEPQRFKTIIFLSGT
ncbi:hypothetical protein TCAL_16581 [Tigriopus californicus]|uniref:Uncharacterized protein n=1 Tax=Tigriopus californicus TaxID=6832 RepID=A0A553NE13_TIGCA|nr:glutamic acid-rich protein-like [Tigriopus californicus]TRY63682.1 hypothetical protein TCAL_16581 [Tigriopus californicus]